MLLNKYQRAVSVQDQKRTERGPQTWLGLLTMLSVGQTGPSILGFNSSQCPYVHFFFSFFFENMNESNSCIVGSLIVSQQVVSDRLFK